MIELKYNLFCTVHSLRGFGLLLEEHCLSIYMMWYIMNKTNIRDEYCNSNTRMTAFRITWYFSEALTGEGERRKGKGTNQTYKSKRVSSTASRSPSAFLFSFKILDVLDQLTRKALVKSSEKESVTFEKNTSGYLWYYSDISYVWGQLQRNITGCQNPAQAVTNRARKKSVLFGFFAHLSSIPWLIHI